MTIWTMAHGSGIWYHEPLTTRSNMKKQFKKAYNELEKKGYAVEDIDHQSGEFQIWCDGAEDRKGVGDYHARGNPNNTEIDDFGIYKEVVEILDKHGMWAEWINAEMAAIHSD